MNIEISTDKLSSDIVRMQEHLENLTKAKTQIYSQLEELNAMWEGPAKKTFAMQTFRDRLVLESLLKNLNHLIECMEYAQSQYDRCNEDVNSKIASIRLSGDT